VTAPQGTGRRPDESMTLLTEVMMRPLDPGYEAAARRRAERAAEGGGPGPGAEPVPHARGALVLGVLLVVGVLLATAFLQARGTRPAGVSERDALVQRIQRTGADADRLQRANAATRVALEAQRGRRLQAQSQGQLAEQVARLGLVTGAVSATGPGLEVTVDDAASVGAAGDGSDPRGDDGTQDGRVLDQDLQLVVNGLWAAGAEAVSINGQRLTTLSAIRSAGEAVLVDYRPLAPPYRILALGDPAGLRSRFTSGPGGRELRDLQSNYGVRAKLATADRLTVPASSGLVTRRATPAGSVPGSLRGAGRSTSPDAGSSAGTDVPESTQETP
jgi:uncharacterized protein YlxW (UPF0749 family)